MIRIKSTYNDGLRYYAFWEIIDEEIQAQGSVVFKAAAPIPEGEVENTMIGAVKMLLK